MLDETWTICGRNKDFVQNESFVTPIKTITYNQLISSVNVPRRYFVHKYDGVSFGSNCSFKIKMFLTGGSYEKE